MRQFGAMRPALLLAALCLGVASVVVWLNDGAWRVTQSQALGMSIGGTEADAVKTLRQLYGNVKFERVETCLGEQVSGEVLVSRDNSWPYALVCVELKDRRVKSINWRKYPLGGPW